MRYGGSRAIVQAAGRNCRRLSASIVLAAAMAALPALAEPPGGSGTPDLRARRLVEAMSLDEKIGMLHTAIGLPLTGHAQPEKALGSAGFNAGLPRLGIPPLQETDAGLGIGNPRNFPFDATAMPASIALGATFDIPLARAYGAAVGAEARALGFGVLLGPGANLIREPRGGRNFEYVSEDPLLTGEIAGAEIAGLQSSKIVATLKHFALNAQENGRIVMNARVKEPALRETDLLAFEIAIERGAPHALMTSYNLVNGRYAAENPHLLSDVLRKDWGFAGWVMADWGGTHGTTEAALAGLDQESGEDDDTVAFFDAPLKTAVRAGRVPMARIDEMVVRILLAQIAAGLVDDPPRHGAKVDLEAHAQVAKTVAASSIVLLKNADDVLPLTPGTRRLLVVGGHADIGVLSGGGSSQVKPVGTQSFRGVPAWQFSDKPRRFHPSSPLAALRRALPNSEIVFDDGYDPAATARAARTVDAVIVFAERWAMESLDLEGLALPFGQDGLIDEVATANPRTIVVLETSGGVTMPWLGKVPAVLEAWYSGGRGGEAIADVLTGKVDPSGRLPVTFPASEAELPRPRLPVHRDFTSNASEERKTASVPMDYDIEGADVGYKWYLRTGRKPLFPFGFGLSYTRFATSNLVAAWRDGAIEVGFDVENTGSREGIDTPQIYLEGGGFTRRLVGWERVALAPGASRHVTARLDPRLAASFDAAAHGWHVAAGRYLVSVRPDALAEGLRTEVAVSDRLIPARHGPCGPGDSSMCVGSR